MIIANEPCTDQLLQESTSLFVSLYFRLLWYHSILRGSIDKKTRYNKRNLKTKQWNPLGFRLFSLASVHDFQIFPDRTAHAWSVEVGTYIRSQSFSSELAVKYLHVGRRKIQISPPLGEQDQSKCPSPGPTKTIKSLSHALSLIHIWRCRRRG